MEKYIRKLGRDSLIISVLLIIIAVFMVIRPASTINVIIIMFGYVLVVDGLIHFASYFTIVDEYRFFSYELAQAIIYIILGFVVVCNVSAVAAYLPIVLGIWIVLEGIFKIQIALNIRDVRDTNWGIMLFMSLVSVALGVVLIFKPFTSFEVLIRVVGCVLLISQLIEIYDDFYIISQVGKAKSMIKEVIEEAESTEKESK